MPIQQLFIATVDSTNNYLRRKLDEGYKAEGMLIVSTDNQTAGRGQRGNSWESEPGKNLMFSILTHPSAVPASRQFIISQAMALVILRVLKSISPPHSQRFTVKWPNDIYYDNSKLGGTLIECDLQGKNIDNCIIGTGLNVNQTRFVSDAPNPISLRQIFGREFDRGVLLSAIIKEFADIYSQLTSKDYALESKPVPPRRLSPLCGCPRHVSRPHCRHRREWPSAAARRRGHYAAL